MLNFLYLYLFFTFLRSIYFYAVGFLFVPPESSKKLKKLPLVTILIPGWNEEVGIVKTVNSCLSQTYSNLEIIVINDGSTDATSKKVRQLMEKTQDPRIKLIDKENGGKWTALNQGVLQANGDWIVTIDADSYLYPDAVELCVNGLQDTKYMAGFGTIKIGNQDNLLEKMQVFEYDVGFHLRKYQSVMNCVSVLPGAFAIFRKDFFEIVGMYDGNTCVEDMELCIRSRYHKNVLMRYIPDAICVTECPATWSGLLRQRFRWKKGLLGVLQMHWRLFFNSPTGQYKLFSFFEYPMIVLSLLELITYPIFFLVLIFSISTSPDLMHSRFVVFYAFYIITIVIILWNDLFNSKQYWKYMLFAPILFSIIFTVEFFAFSKAIYAHFSKQAYTWTVWQRKGI